MGCVKRAKDGYCPAAAEGLATRGSRAAFALIWLCRAGSAIIVRMRIGINAHLLAFTSNYRQAGLSRHIYELVTRVPGVLPQDNFTAFVGNSPVSGEFIAAKPPNLRLSRSRFPTVRAPVRIAWEQLALPFAAAQKKLDLLHCPVNVRPFISPCPVVVTIHDLAFLRYPGSFHPAKRLYLTAMTGWSARHAAHLIAVSEATRRDITNLLGVPFAKVTTVYNGVGTQFMPMPQGEVERFRREKSLPGRVVFYVGTLEPRKNIALLLRAFKSIAEDAAFQDVTLVIGGGKGWYYDEIFATVEQSGLAATRRVRFLGRVPDEELPLWYNTASVFAYPSRYEGFGLPPLEAMACGTPVIAADTSALPEVVGDAGFLLDPDDVSAWSGTIRLLLSNQEVAGQMSAQGLAQASKFSWECTARETAEVYKRVLSS